MRRYRTPNFEEADLARDEMWKFQLSFGVKDRPRQFSVDEGDSCVLVMNSG